MMKEEWSWVLAAWHLGRDLHLFEHGESDKAVLGSKLSSSEEKQTWDHGLSLLPAPSFSIQLEPAWMDREMFLEAHWPSKVSSSHWPV